MRLSFMKHQDGAFTRQALVMFTIASAVLNGMVTASVGAWLAQKYSAAQMRRQAINGLSSLFYERRIKAGMVVSAIRRGVETEELRFRKRSYNESFVDWNRNIRQNLFAIREVLGDEDTTALEDDFQNLLVGPLAQIDNCLTKAYDLKMTGQDGQAQLDACKMAELYQATLDCGASFTNELYKMTRISFLPFAGTDARERSLARQRINRDCVRLPPP
jgi:hypothetical protein